jgi:3-oxoacyl-[acyl-carrier protein] reductase
MELGLNGRVCAVTGASDGIGRETARRLCAEGAAVLLIGRDGNRLDAAVAECESEPGKAAALKLDVTGAAAGARIVVAAEEHFGQLDVLVNNAGTAQRRDLMDVPDEDWQAALDLNVMAPLRVMRAAIPPMAKRGWGRVVNVSSSAAKRPSASMPEYSVAKAAELSLSRLFADRYAGDGVLVNAICPGPVASGLWTGEGGLADQEAELTGTSREEVLEKAAAGRPIGRFAEVGEIADAIVFLCSERASYASGSAWSVDGGAVQVII